MFFHLWRHDCGLKFHIKYYEISYGRYNFIYYSFFGFSTNKNILNIIYIQPIKVSCSAFLCVFKHCSTFIVYYIFLCTWIWIRYQPVVCFLQRLGPGGGGTDDVVSHSSLFIFSHFLGEEVFPQTCDVTLHPYKLISGANPDLT